MANALVIGRLFRDSGKVGAALKLFSQYCEKYPDDYKGYYNVASCCIDLRRYADALPPLQRSFVICNELILNNNDSSDQLSAALLDIYSLMSYVYIKMEQPRLAVNICNEAFNLVSRKDNDSDALRKCYYNYNVAMRQLGLIIDAITVSWTVLRISQKKLRRNILKSALVGNGCARSVMPPSIGSQVVFICMKWGTKYSSEYVNKLYRGLVRFALQANDAVAAIDCKDGSEVTNDCNKESADTLTGSVRLYCFTEDSTGIDPRVKCFPLSPAMNEHSSDSNCATNSSTSNTTTTTNNNDNNKANNNIQLKNTIPTSTNSSINYEKFQGWWVKALLFSTYVANSIRSDMGDCIKESTSQNCSDAAGTDRLKTVDDSDRGPDNNPCMVVYLDLDVIVCSTTFSDILTECDKYLTNNGSSPDKAYHPFITVAAKGLASEGRSVGINSSIIVWRLGTYHFLFDFLNQTASETMSIAIDGSDNGGQTPLPEQTNDYKSDSSGSSSTKAPTDVATTSRRPDVASAVLILDHLKNVIYKFDHYLEMMLLIPEEDSEQMHNNKIEDEEEQTGHHSGTELVLYLQDISHSSNIRTADKASAAYCVTDYLTVLNKIKSESEAHISQFLSPDDMNKIIGENSSDLCGYGTTAAHSSLWNSIAIVIFPLQPKPHQLRDILDKALLVRSKGVESNDSGSSNSNDSVNIEGGDTKKHNYSTRLTTNPNINCTPPASTSTKPTSCNNSNRDETKELTQQQIDYIRWLISKWDDA